jgi:hypothetical protein
MGATKSTYRVDCGVVAPKLPNDRAAGDIPQKDLLIPATRHKPSYHRGSMAHNSGTRPGKAQRPNRAFNATKPATVPSAGQNATHTHLLLSADTATSLTS